MPAARSKGSARTSPTTPARSATRTWAKGRPSAATVTSRSRSDPTHSPKKRGGRNAPPFFIRCLHNESCLSLWPERQGTFHLELFTLTSLLADEQAQKQPFQRKICKKAGCQGIFPRQPGCLLRWRPAAFRPPLTEGLAFQVKLFSAFQRTNQKPSGNRYIPLLNSLYHPAGGCQRERIKIFEPLRGGPGGALRDAARTLVAGSPQPRGENGPTYGLWVWVTVTVALPDGETEFPT